MQKRAHAVNVTIVKRGAKSYYRARLFVPFDKELGKKPSPIDFYSKAIENGGIKAQAIKLRSEYKPKPRGSDTQTSLAAFLDSEFIPYLRSKTRNIEESDERPASYKAFLNRQARIKNYIINRKMDEIATSPLREVRLANLMPYMLDEHFKLLIESRRVSTRVLRELRTDLRMAIEFAGQRIPAQNGYFFMTDFLRGALKRSKSTRQVEVFDHRHIFAAVQDTSIPLRHRALVAFAFCTLCRPSEQFALTWSDVSLPASGAVGTVNFNKAVRLTASGYRVDNGTKVADGIVPLFEPALSLLRELRKTDMTPGFIFKTKTGLGVTHDRQKWVWKAARKALALPDGPRFYDLKHSGNTFLASRGVDAATRAKMMRHADTRMAENVYRSVGDDELEAVSNVFQSELAAIRENQPTARRRSGA